MKAFDVSDISLSYILNMFCMVYEPYCQCSLVHTTTELKVCLAASILSLVATNTSEQDDQFASHDLKVA